jgi:hypothetical protein
VDDYRKDQMDKVPYALTEKEGQKATCKGQDEGKTAEAKMQGTLVSIRNYFLPGF